MAHVDRAAERRGPEASSLVDIGRIAVDQYGA
jgi:hypothetical protein